MNSYKIGFLAEYLAILIYKLKFYTIIHHRKKTFVGEIDVIATRGKKIVFIEVKARKDGISDAIVSKKQQTRIRRAAEVFLSKHSKYNDFDVRFDLVCIQPYKWPLIIENSW